MKKRFRCRELKEAEFSHNYECLSGFFYDERKYYDQYTDEVILPKWLAELIKFEVESAEKRGMRKTLDDFKRFLGL